MTTIALFGAGGKMGCRLTDNLKDSPYQLTYIEISPAGIENLRQRGLTVTAANDALPDADVVILAVPDNLIERISAQFIPRMKSGVLVICLDPAAPLAGKVKYREDIAYFVTHPCHPSVFSYDVTPEQRRDFFGGIKAPQAIVSALLHGKEEDYERGEADVRARDASASRHSGADGNPGTSLIRNYSDDLHQSSARGVRRSNSAWCTSGCCTRFPAWSY
jgi:D-apionate oxidoisomerase